MQRCGVESGDHAGFSYYKFLGLLLDYKVEELPQDLWQAIYKRSVQLYDCHNHAISGGWSSEPIFASELHVASLCPQPTVGVNICTPYF